MAGRSRLLWALAALAAAAAGCLQLCSAFVAPSPPLFISKHQQLQCWSSSSRGAGAVSRSRGSSKHHRRPDLVMANPTQGEVQAVVNMASKAITADKQAQKLFGSAIDVKGVLAAGKPKAGCVNIRFIITGKESSARKTVGNASRAGAQGQVTAQTEADKLVRCWIDLDSGWGRRLYVLGTPSS